MRAPALAEEWTRDDCEHHLQGRCTANNDTGRHSQGLKPGREGFHDVRERILPHPCRGQKMGSNALPCWRRKWTFGHRRTKIQRRSARRYCWSFDMFSMLHGQRGDVRPRYGAGCRGGNGKRSQSARCKLARPSLYQPAAPSWLGTCAGDLWRRLLSSRRDGLGPIPRHAAS